MTKMINKFALVVLGLLLLTSWAQGQGKKANRYAWQYDLKRAERQLRKADAANSTGEPLLRFADVLFYQGKLTDAYDLYRKADSLGKLDQIHQKRNYVYAGIQLYGVSPLAAKSAYFGEANGTYKASKFGVNSDKEDFAPFVWNDLVFVTSSRPTAYNKRKQRYVLTRFPFLDVHVFDHQASGSKASFLPKFLNDSYHDGPIAIAKDTSLVMLTRNYDLPDKLGTHHLYITVFHKEAKGWSDPVRLSFCEPTFTVQHPYYDDQNKVMYFSSNMPGGYGGFDLYRIHWNGKSWTKPENLGAEINTSFDEVFPSMNFKGQLLYATNHIESMGGLDIVLFANGQRQLLPAPINSVYDDFAISFKDEQRGYFTSNRGNAAFDDDIWQFGPAEVLKEPRVVLSVIDVDSRAYLTELMVAYQLPYEAASAPLLVNDERVDVPHMQLTDSMRVLRVYGQKDWVVASWMYEKQGDSLLWVKVFVREKPAEVLPQPMVTRAYFHNDRPRPLDIGPKSTYAESYKLFGDSLATYYQASVDSRERLEGFWNNEVNVGWERLQQMHHAISTHLGKGGTVEIALSGHCSPLHTDTYNVALAKRRVEVVRRFLVSNQPKAGVIKVQTTFPGESMAKPDVSADLDNTPESVYSIKASQERRVEIKVVFK